MPGPYSRRGFIGGLAAGAAGVLSVPAYAEEAGQEAVARTGRLPVRNEMRSERDWARFLGKQDLVWGRLPRVWHEGPFLGNGLLGSMLYVPTGSNAVKIDIQHSAVQDHRPQFGSTFGMARLPIGHFTLEPVGAITGVDWRLDLWNAELRGTITTDQGTIGLSAYVHNDRSILLLRLRPSAGEASVKAVFHWEEAISPRARTNTPPAGYTGNPPPTLETAGDVQLVVQPLLAGGQTVTAYRDVEHDEERRLYVTVAHSHPDESARGRAIAAIESVVRRPPSQLARSHRDWWHRFYPKSFLSIPDQRLQSFYWIQLYKIASATRENAPVMATTGPWLQPTGWPAIWWNLNVQLEYWMIYGSNHLELDAVTRTLDENRQHLTAAVPDAYQHDSAAIARSSDMNCRPGRVGIPGQGQPEVGNLTWALHNVWLSYRHSMDDDLLRDVLFPLLRKAINYYLHFLAPGEDGRLHLPTTFSPEYGGAPDCNYDLALIRWGCGALLEATERLGIDDPLASRWRQVLDTLVDYPVDANGYMVGTGVPFAKSHRHYSHLLMVYPLYLINWEQPENQALIERSLRHWIGFEGALQGYSFTGAASIAAQMGRGDEARHYLKELLRRGFVKPNTMYFEGGGPVIETPLSAAQSLHDLLVQSWGGVIRVFPAAPHDWADLTVHDFRTEGAFLISAVRRGGATSWIRVHSLAGEPCRVRHGIAGPIQVLGCRGPVRWRELGNGVIELDLRADDEVLISRRGARDFVIAPVPISEPADPWGLPPIPPPGETVPVTLEFDNDGIAFDSNVADGNFDGSGYSFPGEELPPAGPLTHEGATFVFPAYDDGLKNNVTAAGQTIEVPPGRYSKLRVLGAASFGEVSTNLTATYADGSTGQISLTLPDWGRAASGGAVELLRTTHRHGPTGPSNLRVGIFHQTATLDPARELRSLTLPTLDRPQLHLFALSVEKPR